MIIGDQSEALALLADPARHDGAPVERIDTHISHIVLAGTRAFKMKRAVKLPYLDFSTPELRLAACRKEQALNTPTAPGLYLGVHTLTREGDGQLALDGSGALVDAFIEMRRFEQSRLFDQMALAGTLDEALMTRVAVMIRRAHEAATVAHTAAGAAPLADVIAMSAAEVEASGMLEPALVSAFASACRASLARHAALLDARAAAGKVRRCHGDLHLRNICLLEGEPRLFDCIEFNERIATIDVLYDLAFLLMDLWHRDLGKLANLVANRYFDGGEDEAGFALLPLLMALRAGVRAQVAATQAAGGGPEVAALAAEARAYLDLAQQLLTPQTPRLVIIGGLSGSGKSTLAEALAPHLGAPPGARIVESDRVRKALHGVAAETKLPAEAYAPEVSEQVYATISAKTRIALSSGVSVIANAVFNREAGRRALEAVATDLALPASGFWLETAPETLHQRILARKGAASDATPEVLEFQQAEYEADAHWTTLDASLPVATNVKIVLNQLG